MTDQERAAQVVLTWAGDDVMVPQAREMALSLAMQFMAVRAEERRVVADRYRGHVARWRNTLANGGGTGHVVAAMDDLLAQVVL